MCLFRKLQDIKLYLATQIVTLIKTFHGNKNKYNGFPRHRQYKCE
jgi:hypothetical protein